MGEFLFAQTITQQSSRPFVINHFAHGILMDYNVNKPILVFWYRFNIYQWTASNMTKSFLLRRTISHKSTRLFYFKNDHFSILFEPFRNSSLDHLILSVLFNLIVFVVKRPPIITAVLVDIWSNILHLEVFAIINKPILINQCRQNFPFKFPSKPSFSEFFVCLVK